MRKLKRVLCFALTLCLLSCTVVFSASAEEPEENTYDITVVGDSISTGYGLPSYHKGLDWSNFWYVNDVKTGVAGSYAQLLQEKMQSFFRSFDDTTTVNLNMDGHIAWRSTEFLNMLAGAGCKIPEYDPCYKDPYMLDWLTLWGDDGVTWGGTDFFRRAFTLASPVNVDNIGAGVVADISNSELVTVNFGSNDIFTYALMSVIGKWASPLLKPIWEGETLDTEDLGVVVNAFFELLVNAGPDQRHTILGDLVNAMEIGLARYQHNLPLILDAIHAINEDATIAVVGVTDPLNNPLRIGDLNIDLVTYFDPYVARANAVALAECAAADYCVYADMAGTSYWGLSYTLTHMDFEHLDEDLATTVFYDVIEFVKSVHPDDLGHQHMAEKLYNAVMPRLCAPEEVSVERSLLNKPLVTWESVPGAYGYVVYRSTLRNGVYLPVKIVSGSATKALDLSALSGVSYYYRVSAVLNGTGTLRTPMSDYAYAPRLSSSLAFLKPLFDFNFGFISRMIK